VSEIIAGLTLGRINEQSKLLDPIVM